MRVEKLVAVRRPSGFGVLLLAAALFVISPLDAGAEAEPDEVRIAKQKIEAYGSLVIRACYVSASLNRDGLTYQGWAHRGLDFEVRYRFDYTDGWLQETIEHRYITFVVTTGGTLIDVVDSGGSGTLPIFAVLRVGKFGVKFAIKAFIRARWLKFAFDGLAVVLDKYTEPGRIVSATVNFLSDSPDPPKPAAPVPVPNSAKRGAPVAEKPPVIDDQPLQRPTLEPRPIDNGRFCFEGPHPNAAGVWEASSGRHYDQDPPLDVRLFAYRDGCYFFVGDPLDFGYVDRLYGYLSFHPIPLEYGGGWCFMDGVHGHPWQASASPNFVPVVDWMYWDGPIGAEVQPYQAYFVSYFLDYYPTYYARNRYRQTLQAAPAFDSIPVYVWGAPPVQVTWSATGAWPDRVEPIWRSPRNAFRPVRPERPPVAAPVSYSRGAPIGAGQPRNVVSGAPPGAPPVRPQPVAYPPTAPTYPQPAARGPQSMPTYPQAAPRYPKAGTLQPSTRYPQAPSTYQQPAAATAPAAPIASPPPVVRYPQAAPVYQQPTTRYPQPAPTYQQPLTRYPSVEPTYPQPTPRYLQPAPVPQQPMVRYPHARPTYQQPARYPQPGPAFQRGGAAPRVVAPSVPVAPQPRPAMPQRSTVPRRAVNGR